MLCFRQFFLLVALYDVSKIVSGAESPPTCRSDPLCLQGSASQVEGREHVTHAKLFEFSTRVNIIPPPPLRMTVFSCDSNTSREYGDAFKRINTLGALMP